jgi:hypothetical protein
MARLVTLQLPDETLQRCQRGATAARKRLEEFLVERLMEAIPPPGRRSAVSAAGKAEGSAGAER